MLSQQTQAFKLQYLTMSTNQAIEEMSNAGEAQGADRSRLEQENKESTSHLWIVIAAVFRSRLSAKAAYNIFIEDLVLAKVLTAEETEKAKDTFVWSKFTLGGAWQKWL